MQRPRQLAEFLARLGSQERCSDERCSETSNREADEGGPEADVRERGKHAGCDCTAERNGRLSDAECKTALLRSEPAHHCAAARGLCPAAERTGDRERRDESREG